MSPIFMRSARYLNALTLAVGAALFLSSCTPGQTKTAQPIKIDGSSTVYPITEKIVQQYNNLSPSDVEVSANFSGTGGGFEKFCAGETDINNASRPILKAEIEICKKNNISYIELPIAFDALTIVVNPKNTWANDITVEELKKIWEPAAQGKIKTWNQVRASWPNQPLNLYGPGQDSGTYDYFTAAIVGQTGESRTDYQASEDDEVIEQRIANISSFIYLCECGGCPKQFKTE